MKTLIIIPAYNEEDTIFRTVMGAARWLPGADILVIDDGSTDKTQDSALTAFSTFLLPQGRNGGYSEALQTGYGFALQQGYDYVLQMDADGQHVPRYLRALLHAVRGRRDVVIGSRFLSGKSYRVPVCRRIGMRLFAWVAFFKTGLKLTDTTSGYRAYSKRAIQKVLKLKWAYPDANLLVQLHRAGMKITEIPVIMHPNLKGKSMHSGIWNPIKYTAYMLREMWRV